MIAAAQLDGAVGDIVYLLLTAAFFGLAALLVGACRRIAGDADAAAATTTATATAAATGPADEAAA